MRQKGKAAVTSLGLRCLGLVGLLFLASSLPLLWSAWEAEAARERAAAIAQSAADQVRAAIRDQVNRFERATGGVRVQDVQSDTTMLTARLLRMEPAIAPAFGLSVLNPRGIQIASTLLNGASSSPPGWLARAIALKTRDTMIFAPDPSADAQSWMLVRRIEDSQGALVAIIASSLPVQAVKAIITPTTRGSLLAYFVEEGNGSGRTQITSQPLGTPELPSPLGFLQAWIPTESLAPQSSTVAMNNLQWTGTANPTAILQMQQDEINDHGRVIVGLWIALVAFGSMLTFVPGGRITGRPEGIEGVQPTRATSVIDAEVEELRRELGDLAQERDRVLAAIGHDVRTPINSILGICALLLDGDLDDGQRKWLQRVRASCEALLAMLNGMLEIAAARVDGAEVHKEDVALANLIEEVGEVLRPQAHDKGLELKVVVEDSLLGTWSADPTRLRQVLFNLTGNAVKYTMHGSIEIRALVCADQGGQAMLELRVSDTGPGIAEDERELIFDQFRRGRDEVSRGQEGLGLGLALCRDIAVLLGGSLSVESTLSIGSVFTFKMPIERVEPSRARGLLAGRTALVVGLSEGLRRRVASQLEGMGFDVETAGDGFMAMGAAERTVYQHGALDLLVLDAALAAPPAEVLLVRLKANRSFERTRTVLVSNGPAAGPIEGRADLVISHPVEASDLDRAIAALFETTSPLHEVYPRAPASPKQRVLVVEDNRINQALFLDVLSRSNFSAFAASSGEEAVQAVERGGFDLILMDVQMPGIDGTEATRRIRALDLQRRVPIVGLTAHSGAVMRKRCMDAGMDLVLHKPVDLSRLPLRVRKVINTAASTEKGALETGPAEHDPTLDIADEYVAVLISELGVERARACVTGFLADTALHIPALLQQAEGEDWQALASFAHSLAGAAGTLGAVVLGDALLMAEDCARAGHKDRLASALKEVQVVWDRTRTGLLRHFEILAAKRSHSQKKAA